MVYEPVMNRGRYGTPEEINPGVNKIAVPLV